MIKRWYGIVIMSICFSLSFSLTATAATAASQQDIKLYVNDQYISGITPVVKAGVMYVPFRKFFNHFGYEVHYDRELNGIYAFNQKLDRALELYYSLDEGYNTSIEVYTSTEEDDSTYYYYLEQPAIVINGSTYFPIRVAVSILGFSVAYDKANQRADLLEYGYGEWEHIEQLIKKYNITYSMDLLTWDHYDRYYSPSDYDNKDYDWQSIIADPNCIVTIESINFISANQAELIASATKIDELFTDYKVGVYTVRKENGQWLISSSNFVKSEIKLVANLDQVAATITQEQHESQQAVLEDLRSYYFAYNKEDVKRTLYYTSPYFLERWDSLWESSTWADVLKVGFEMSDVRYTLSDGEVVSISEDKAVVYGTLERRESFEASQEDVMVFPALIYMDYANGHWNYYDELDLQANSYDRTKTFSDKQDSESWEEA